MEYKNFLIESQLDEERKSSFQRPNNAIDAKQNIL